MKIATSYLDLIGNTPLVELSRIEKKENLSCRILAKVEMHNPSGSVKIRIAKHMIDVAFQEGLINDKSIIIEATSGNTGVALALVCACFGLHFIATMPESMSIERRKLIKAYGGEIILTPKEDGMKGAVNKALQLKEVYGNAFIPSQFENKANPEAYYLSLGREIYRDIDGKIDILVAGIGTGGTISGCARYFKEINAKVKIIGVEPSSSPLISKGVSGSHQIQGIGANFIPKTLALDLIDNVVTIKDEEAFLGARMLAQIEGLFVGISSGAAFYAALNEVKKEENKGKNIVVILPDTGERYLSTELVS